MTNSQFTHIQILSKPVDSDHSSEHPSHDLSEPIFRNASLMQETKLAASPLAAPTTESLANNTQGTTFAAKARAAELQAARSRRELNSQQSSSSPLPSTNDTMTFKPKKPGRTWKRINLSDLPGLGDEEDLSDFRRQDSDVNLSSLVASKSASSENLQGFYDGSNAFLPTLAEASVIDNQGQHVTGNTSPEHTVQSSDDGRVFRMMTPEFESTGENSQSALASMVSRHRPPEPARSTTNPPGLGSRKSSNTWASGSGEEFYSYSDVHASIPIAYTQAAHIPPLKSKPPHLYPAVKGTQNDAGYKFPPPGLLPPVDPAVFATPGLFESAQIGFSSFPPSTFSNHTEKENELIHPRANLLIHSQEPPNRTVLHDPYKQDLYNSSEELPWKSRIVPVVTPTIGQAESNNQMTFEDYELTPEGAIKMGPPPNYVASPRPSLPAATAEDRFHPDLMPWMRSTMAQVRAQNEMKGLDPVTRHIRESAALARANFSDEGPYLQFDPLNPLGVSSPTTPSRNPNDSNLNPNSNVPKPNPKPDAPDPEFTIPDQERIEEDRKLIEELLLPALGSLKTDMDTHDYFNKFGQAPEWCIDRSGDGNRSFFGGDWGAPPQRVGRDPRYAFRAVEGRGLGLGVGFEGWGGMGWG
ncbi:MAG: hypothetical protein MMC23_004311 [Stictis urceolatum]|nr:hypothetical protein [Stictis urceolata]